MKGQFWKSGSALRIAQSAMTPPTCLCGVVRLSFFFLIFSQIINFPWFNMLISKKPLGKDKKAS